MRTTRTASLAAGALLALAAFLVPGTAAADWLVTRGGERIETAGAWSERGALVVFRLADGTLASLRRSEVDLEASREATAGALQPEPGADREAAAPRAAVLVLTDDDLPWRPPEPAGAAPAEEGPAERVRVVEWREEAEGDGLAIVGSVVNASADDAVAGVGLTVRLLGPEGEEIASAAARLGRSALMPGERSDFVAAFDSFLSFSEVGFAASAVALRTGPPARAGLPPLEEPRPAEPAADEPGAGEPGAGEPDDEREGSQP